MKKVIVLGMAILMILATMLGASARDTQIQYLQGYVLDNAGDPATTGTLETLIYDSATSGNLLFNQTYSGVLDATGHFAVPLGNDTSFNLSAGTNYYYDMYWVNSLGMKYDQDFDGEERKLFYLPFGNNTVLADENNTITEKMTFTDTGSATSPTIIFDDGTGIYSETNNQIGFSTSGTYRLFMDNSGVQTRELFPRANNSYDLGINNRYWKDLYTTDSYVAENAYFSGGYGDTGVTIYEGGNIKMNGELWLDGDLVSVQGQIVNGSMIPGTDDTYTLGNSTYKWQSINVGQGTSSNPSIAFGDGDTGIYETSDDILWLELGGTSRYEFTSTHFSIRGGNSPQLNSQPNSYIIPKYVFNSDGDTGMGTGSDDNLSLIAGGKEMLRLYEGDSNKIIIPNNDTWISSFNALGTDEVNMFKVTDEDEILTGASLITGTLKLPEDAGIVSYLNLPVSSSSVAGTEHGYTFNIDSSNLMEIKAESDGVGSVQTPVIETNARMEFNGYSLNNVSVIKVDEEQNYGSTTGIMFGDGDTGFYEYGDDGIKLKVGGGNVWQFTSNFMGSASNSRSKFLYETPTSTNPDIVVVGTDDDTGLGWAGANNLSIIAGGEEIIRAGGIITMNKDVGIGTSNPNSTLSVVGSIEINGTSGYTGSCGSGTTLTVKAGLITGCS